MHHEHCVNNVIDVPHCFAFSNTYSQGIHRIIHSSAISALLTGTTERVADLASPCEGAQARSNGPRSGDETMTSIHAIVSAIWARRRERGSSRSIRKVAITHMSKYAHAGAEPSLEEVLADPIVHLIVEADRLELGVVRRTLTAARRRLSFAVVDYPRNGETRGCSASISPMGTQLVQRREHGTDFAGHGEMDERRQLRYRGPGGPGGTETPRRVG